MTSVEAATSTPVFLAFLDHVPLPELARRPGGARRRHRGHGQPGAARGRGGARADRGRGGLKPRFLPRYSPALSPIEPCWSKVKTLLRAKEARSVEALDRELPGVVGAVSARDARGRFRHCGYQAPD
jgi:transposase